MSQTNSAAPAMAERESLLSQVRAIRLFANGQRSATGEDSTNTLMMNAAADTIERLAALSHPVGAGTDMLRDDKIVTWNGLIYKMQGAELSDLEVAGRVRMLMRSDLNHESVCTLARDRIIYLSALVSEARAALAAPDAVTPAPAGGGIEGLRARIEAERNAWINNGLVTDKARVLGEVLMWMDEGPATRTPAGAAVDPVGVWVEGLRSRIISAAQIHLGKYDIGVGEYEKIADAALANRPASQAPAASPGREGATKIKADPNAVMALAIHHAINGDTSMIERLEAERSALAPTAQVQPAGQEEIADDQTAAFIAECDAAELIERLKAANPYKRPAVAQDLMAEAAALIERAILAARPVADGVAESLWKWIEERRACAQGYLDLCERNGADNPYQRGRASLLVELARHLRTPATAPAAQSIGGSV